MEEDLIWCIEAVIVPKCRIWTFLRLFGAVIRRQENGVLRRELFGHYGDIHNSHTHTYVLVRMRVL